MSQMSNGFITEKTILFQVSRGGPTFSSVWGGVQILISIEPCITSKQYLYFLSRYNLLFSEGGGPDRYPPPI